MLILTCLNLGTSSLTKYELHLNEELKKVYSELSAAHTRIEELEMAMDQLRLDHVVEVSAFQDEINRLNQIIADDVSALRIQI